ncbi:MAG: hypothetical protein H7Z43_02155 [Clostridia bacterium]|nr:hypothetical protein [Deltaproteobacteria bacterium]
MSNLSDVLRVPKAPAVMNTGSTARGETMLPLTYSVQDELAKCHGSHREALAARHRARVPSSPVDKSGRVLERVLTISDTHPSSGINPETGRFDALDDFPPEQQRQLSSWLAREWLTATKNQESSWVHDDVFGFSKRNADRNPPIETMRALRNADKVHTLRLLLLGDILDFLQVPRPTPGFTFPDGLAPHGRAPKNTPANALVQLNIMHAGHRDYFKTMAIHLFLGHDVDYVPGNHDRPMLHPLVWGGELESTGRTLYGFTRLIALELRALGANEDEVRDALSRLRMLPMVFIDDTVFEHGDQNDSYNKTRRPLKELVEPTPIHDEMDMAIGDYGVRDGFNDLERARPSLDGVSSPLRFLSKAAAVPTYTARMVGSFILGVGREGYNVSPLADQKVRENDIAAMVKLTPQMLEAANEIRPASERLSEAQLIEGLQQIDRVSARPFFSNFRRGTSFLRRLATIALRGLVGDVDIRNNTTARRDRIDAYHRLGFNNYVDGHTHVAKNDAYLTENEQFVRHINTHTWTDKNGDWNEDGNRWGDDSRGVGVMERGVDANGDRWSELSLMRVIDEDGALVQGELIEQYETQEQEVRKRAREIYRANAGSTREYLVQEPLRLAPTESRFLEDAHAPGQLK